MFALYGEMFEIIYSSKSKAIQMFALLKGVEKNFTNMSFGGKIGLLKNVLVLNTKFFGGKNYPWEKKSAFLNVACNSFKSKYF